MGTAARRGRTMEAAPGVAAHRERLMSSKTLLARAERAVPCWEQPIPCLPASARPCSQVRGCAIPFPSPVPRCSPAPEECVCCAGAHPCRTGSSRALHGRACSCTNYFISSPQHTARCQKNTTVQSVCEDVKACPEPSKYRCAGSARRPLARAAWSTMQQQSALPALRAGMWGAGRDLGGSALAFSLL